MNPNETSVNGEQAEQLPGTSSFGNSIESSVPSLPSTPNEGDFAELFNSLFNTDEVDESTLRIGPYQLCKKCGKVHSTPASFPDDDSIPWNEIPCPSTVGDHGSSPPMVSPVSTYSFPTMPSTPEDAEALNEMEGAESSAMDNISGTCIFNVSNPENSVLPAALSKPGCSRTCTGCQDAPGLTASEIEIKRHKFFKGVSKKKAGKRNSDKWTCEIRISKTFLQDSKLKPKGKQWLGTFDTRCQAARALHVGRFLLSEKKKNSATIADFEQNPETIRALSEFKDFTRGKPLDAELLLGVKKLAADYGKNGSL